MNELNELDRKLGIAAERGNFNKVKRLIRKGADDANTALKNAVVGLGVFLFDQNDSDSDSELDSVWYEMYKMRPSRRPINNYMNIIKMMLELGADPEPAIAIAANINNQELLNFLVTWKWSVIHKERQTARINAGILEKDLPGDFLRDYF